MSVIDTILRIESGGRNVTQGNIGDINNARGTPAQGYFQITDPTWAQFGGLSTGYSSALQAPYETQLQVAQNIPIGRWGPATQSALQSAGYSYSPNETLGQVLNRYGETPSTDGMSLSGADATGNYGDITGYNVAGVNDTGISHASDALGGNAVDIPSLNDPSITGGQDTASQGTFDWSTLAGADNPIASAGPLPAQTAQGQYTQGTGSPLTITNASLIGETAGKNVTAATDALSKQIGASTTSIAQTAGVVEQATTTAAGNFLVRGGFILAGLTVLLGAFAFYWIDAQSGGRTAKAIA